MAKNLEVRDTVHVVHDPDTGKAFLRGTETCDKRRANVFGLWRDRPPDRQDDFEYDGFYGVARSDSPVGVEVEARHAFDAVEDAEDHAEVYLWQAYYWELTPDGPICQKDDMFHGEYVVEAGGLEGPMEIFSPLVDAAVDRIHQARWHEVLAPTRQVGTGGM